MVGSAQKGQIGFHHENKRHSMKLLRNHTNQSAKTLLVFGFTSLVAATTLFGQIGIGFDERGNMTNGTAILRGSVGTDPSGGIAGVPVLIYTLPFGVLPGDVLLTDQVGANQFSDVIRFWNPTGNANQSLIIFYSDLPEPAGENPPLADVGLPLQLQSNIQGPFLEIGTEASNFYDYAPVLFMPGSVAAGSIHYHIVSDGVVPEPNTCSLVVLGSGLLIGLKRRFQSSRK
jgi:hypothetical protein